MSKFKQLLELLLDERVRYVELKKDYDNLESFNEVSKRTIIRLKSRIEEKDYIIESQKNVIFKNK